MFGRADVTRPRMHMFLGQSRRCRSGHRPVDWLNKDDKLALTRELRNARGRATTGSETSCAEIRASIDYQRVSASGEKNTVRALL